jgi:hypothetical protein
MSTTLEQLHALAEQLSPNDQKQVLEIMEELLHRKTPESDLPPGKPGSVLLRFSLPPEDVDAMERAIMEYCERV